MLVISHSHLASGVCRLINIDDGFIVKTEPFQKANSLVVVSRLADEFRGPLVRVRFCWRWAAHFQIVASCLLARNNFSKL